MFLKVDLMFLVLTGVSINHKIIYIKENNIRSYVQWEMRYGKIGHNFSMDC